MRKNQFGKSLAVILLTLTMFVLPLSVAAQTRIVAPKNKYKVQDDIKLGDEAARQVEQTMPVLSNARDTEYLESVGQRLVRAVPNQFQHPEFNYRFKIVNASDINAFALPGGAMFVNRGMIEAAKNEGEMAGVMAHELSHVVLRHGTAQATKQSSVGTQLGNIGLILGGAILGGQAGAQIGAAGAQVLNTRYSREYEKQADILGAQIMANAGYDPRDLANMFRTIEQQSGGRSGPEWLSDHPNPGNRYEYINQEAQMLRVSPNPIKLTGGFERTKADLSGLPAARSSAEIEKGQAGQTGQTSPTANGKYENTVAFPSAQTKSYRGGNFLSVNYPGNWQVFEEQSGVQFAPSGAYGSSGITRGAMFGVGQTNGTNLSQATQEYVSGLLQSNAYLRQSGTSSRTTIDGKPAYQTTLSGRSEITGKTEIVTIYTTLMSNNQLFYAATVAPQDESSRYSGAFRTMLNSIRLAN